MIDGAVIWASAMVEDMDWRCRLGNKPWACSSETAELMDERSLSPWYVEKAKSWVKRALSGKVCWWDVARAELS